MIKRIIKYGLLIFIWATFLFMTVGIAFSVFDPTSEDYNDYPLILFVTIIFFPLAYPSFDDWWNDNKTQKAINKFITNYANTTNNISEEIKKIIIN